jgi:2-polyprenyl-3-methyl-5-hydroxy-6-metoxy-1,4-benzoquinol methylase
MLPRAAAKEGKRMTFEELKSKQSAMWGNGPYQNITETLTDLHELVIDRLAPAEGVTWLDLACGTGAMAELAAKRGADVTGIDLAPALIETAKERAHVQGLSSTTASATARTSRSLTRPLTSSRRPAA